MTSEASEAHMEELGNTGEVAGEIPLCLFRYTFATPGNENVLRQSGIGVCHFDIGKLDSTFRKLLNEICQLPVCMKQSIWGPATAGFR